MYWLLFIYYSFQGIDELIELYAVYFKREKGALGLLFEMNYFMGAGIAVYLMIFNNSSEVVMHADEGKTDYTPLQSWISFQCTLVYVFLGISFIMGLVFWHMNKGFVKAAEQKSEVIKAEKTA